jgi:hypothetical protein
MKITHQLMGEWIGNIIKVKQALQEQVEQPIFDPEQKAAIDLYQRAISGEYEVQNPGEFNQIKADAIDAFGEKKKYRSKVMAIEESYKEVKEYFVDLIGRYEDVGHVIQDYPSLALYLPPDYELLYENFLPTLLSEEIDEVMGWDRTPGGGA